MRRELQRWRKEGSKGDTEKRGKSKRICALRRKEKETERWEKEIKEARMEEQIWKIINRGSKCKKDKQKYMDGEMGRAFQKAARWGRREIVVRGRKR